MKPNFFLPAISLIFSLSFSPVSQAQTFKIATIAPDGSFWMTMIKDAAKEIKSKTEGRVKFKFYPGGVMGNQDTVLKKMRIGQLQGGALTNGTLGPLYPDSQIYSLPLIFKNIEEVDYVRSKMDDQIIAGFENAGIVPLGISEGGLTYAMSDQPVTRTTDLLQHKVWRPTNNKNVALTLEAFDISPIPLSIGDVLIGLQTSLIDTVATTPTAAIALQWHTQIKYITDVPFIYFYSVLAVDKKAFDKLSESDQVIVRQVMADTIDKIDEKNREDNIAALAALQNTGITLLKPDSEELSGWYEKGDEATRLIFSEGDMSEKTINALLKHLDTFRSQQSSIVNKQNLL